MTQNPRILHFIIKYTEKRSHEMEKLWALHLLNSLRSNSFHFSFLAKAPHLDVSSFVESLFYYPRFSGFFADFSTIKCECIKGIT